MPFIIIGIIFAIVFFAAVIVAIVFVARSIDINDSGQPEQPKETKKPSFWKWILTPGYKRAGIRGEEAATRVIQSVLETGDRLFSNVNVEYDGKPAELDNVVVNKYGVFIIEVKNYTGTIVGSENDYEWKKYKTTDAGNQYEKNVRNPIRQVKRQVYILARYLENNGVKVWVRGYVILLHGNSPVESDCILTCVDDINRAIHTADRRMLDEKTVDRISGLFL